MSNIGKRPIQFESGTQITVDGRNVTVTGIKGTLTEKLPGGIDVEISDNVVTVKKKKDTKELEKFYGLSRALIANMVNGVTKGFEKKLELSGVGYRAKVDGRDLVLNVGYAHPVKVSPPEGVTISVAENVITVAGADKELVGNLASKIREVRPPDPYKAKGVKYADEIIKKKPGKSAKAA